MKASDVSCARDQRTSQGRYRRLGGAQTIAAPRDEPRAVFTGANLTFGPLASSKKACAGAGVDVQEAAYFAALAKVKTFAFSGDKLELRDAEGALQVSYQPTLAQ